MAAENGSTEYPVIQTLFDKPQSFSFYQAVSLLQEYAEQQQEIAPVGRNGPVQEEVIRFRPTTSMAFASADLSHLEILPDNTQKFRLEVSFMGLYGAVSPLPTFYSEAIITQNNGQSARRDFLDLFHHRAISLHYRILRKYMLTRGLKPGLRDPVSNWLLALIGLYGIKNYSQQPLGKLNRLLANLGLIATQNRSAAMIAFIISYYFSSLPVRIEEFVQRRVDICNTQQNRLGVRQSELGLNMTLGASVLDCASKFRLHLGPLKFEQFLQFLPDGKNHQELISLTRYLLQDPLSFDLGLTLESNQAPRFTLSVDTPCRLGWSCWLGKAGSDQKSVIISRSMA